MRWGVRDEATDNHLTAELCMAELAECERISVGVTFVSLQGQKYGYRFFVFVFFLFFLCFCFLSFFFVFVFFLFFFGGFVL